MPRVQNNQLRKSVLEMINQSKNMTAASKEIPHIITPPHVSKNDPSVKYILNKFSK